MKKLLALFVVFTLLTGCGKSVYYTDAQSVVSNLENTHPAFKLNKVPEGYENAKAEFLKKSKTVDNIDDFELMVFKYLSAMEDMHTASGRKNKCSEKLNIKCREKDGKLYLVNDSGQLTESYILSIGGIDIDKIFETVDIYYSEENNAGISFFHENYSLNKEVLILSGCNTDNRHINVVCNDKEFNAAFINRKKSADKIKSATTELRGDILYIDFNACTIDDDYRTALGSIRSYVSGGGRKIVADVRGNVGGKENVVVHMIEAMGMNMPQYGRYSDNFSGSLNSAKQNPDVDLAVLCDELTFSGGLYFTVCVQDGKLGTVIGQPSINSPSFYADYESYTTENTNTPYYISADYLTRPDPNANQEQIVPDIVLDEEIDSLDYAINTYFKQ